MYTPVSQFVPSYPAAHVQVYLLIEFSHVPPFLHGLLEHSSISSKEICSEDLMHYTCDVNVHAYKH